MCVSAVPAIVSDRWRAVSVRFACPNRAEGKKWKKERREKKKNTGRKGKTKRGNRRAALVGVLHLISTACFVLPSLSWPRAGPRRTSTKSVQSRVTLSQDGEFSGVDFTGHPYCGHRSAGQCGKRTSLRKIRRKDIATPWQKLTWKRIQHLIAAKPPPIAQKRKSSTPLRHSPSWDLESPCPRSSYTTIPPSKILRIPYLQSSFPGSRYSPVSAWRSTHGALVPRVASVTFTASAWVYQGFSVFTERTWTHMVYAIYPSQQFLISPCNTQP